MPVSNDSVSSHETFPTYRRNTPCGAERPLADPSNECSHLPHCGVCSRAGDHRSGAFLSDEHAKPPAPAALRWPPNPHPRLQTRPRPRLWPFFGLLQEKGRFVDFLMEDVAPYDDTQVGAAARVVHQGCREVLHEHFKVTPISQAEEGSRITMPGGIRGGRISPARENQRRSAHSRALCSTKAGRPTP